METRIFPSKTPDTQSGIETREKYRRPAYSTTACDAARGDPNREAGLRNLTIPEVIELKMHGVEAEYIREIHSYGFGPYSAREAIELRAQGLRVKDFREAGSYGRNLTLRQIVRLKQAGGI